MTQSQIYSHKALLLAEKYGVIKYKVQRNLMIYNVSYPQYLSVPRYTVQHTINLDTMEDTARTLKRYDKSGEVNR